MDVSPVRTSEPAPQPPLLPWQLICLRSFDVECSAGGAFGCLFFCGTWDEEEEEEEEAAGKENALMKCCSRAHYAFCSRFTFLIAFCAQCPVCTVCLLV